MSPTAATPLTATPATRPTPASPPRCDFTHRFGRPLPSDFAREAAGLSWRELVETYAPSADTFRLADLTRTPVGRGLVRTELRLGHPGSHGMQTTGFVLLSTGDFAATSEALHRLGAPVETERIHHYASDGTRCAVLRATDGRRVTWALGFGETSGEAGVRALLAAAGILHLDPVRRAGPPRL